MRRLIRLVSAAVLAAATLVSILPTESGATLHSRRIRFSRGATLVQGSSQRPTTDGPGAARKLAGQVTLDTSYMLSDPYQIDALSSAQVLASPNGCGTPLSVTVVGDSFYVVWATNCVDPNESVLMRFTANDSIANCGTGKWKDNADVTVANAVCSQTNLPGMDRRALVGLGVLMAITALAVLRRRYVLAVVRS